MPFYSKEECAELLAQLGAKTPLDNFTCMIHALIVENFYYKKRVSFVDADYRELGDADLYRDAWVISDSMRKFLDALKLPFQITKKGTDWNTFTKFIDRIELHYDSFFLHFCSDLVLNYDPVLKALTMPVNFHGEYLRTPRTLFYSCLRFLIVIILHQQITVQHRYTTDQLNRRDDKLLPELLEYHYYSLSFEIQEAYSKLKEFGLEEVCDIWKSLYGLPIDPPKVTRSSYTSAALEILEEMNFSSDQKLLIYANARMYGKVTIEPGKKETRPMELLRTAIYNELSLDNPTTRNFAMKESTVLRPSDGGRYSFQADHFMYEHLTDEALTKLSRVEPTTFFLRWNNYGRRKVELYTECNVVYSEQTRRYDMVLNPNPLMIEILSDTDTPPVFLFESLNEGYLYLTQFPKLKIGWLRLDESPGIKMLTLSGNKSYFFQFSSQQFVPPQTILAFHRSSDGSNRLSKIYEVLSSYLSPVGYLDIFCPNIAYDESGIRQNPQIPLPSRVVTFPSYPKNNHEAYPKKYICLRYIKDANPDGFFLYKLFLSNPNGPLMLFPYAALIKREHWEMPKTVNWLWSNSHTLHMEKKERKTRSYEFSPEIIIWYSWSKGQKGGQYYYSAIPTEKQRKQNPMSRGKRLTDRHRFSATTLSSAEEIVKESIYNDDIRAAIESDVKKHIKDDRISFMSYFYCFEKELARMTFYNKDASWMLFTQEAFKKLYINMQTPYTLQDFQPIVEEILEENESKQLTLQYWEQLNNLLNHMKTKRVILSNPVKSYLYAMRDRDERYRYVRNGLVKKSFLRDEERGLIAYLESLIPESGLSVGCAVRFFTGIGPPELRALNWGDCIKIPHMNGGMLIITKQMDGNEVKYYNSDDPKIRYIPCCTELYEMLMARRKYMANVMGIPETALVKENFPMISGDEDDYTKRASVKQVYYATRKFIGKAAVEEDKIYLPDSETEDREDDINNYHGELLRANYEYRALHTCGFTLGELCHVLGRAAPNTFSKNYCDYDCETSQAIMLRKLMRWTSFREQADQPKIYRNEKVISEQSELVLKSKSYDRPYYTEIEITNLEETPIEVDVCIHDASGADIEILREK